MNNPEEEYIHREELENMCDTLKEMFNKRASNTKAFDVWMMKNVMSKPIRNIAMTLHLSRKHIWNCLDSIDSMIKSL